METYKLLKLKTYPYGYSWWINKVWQECRRRGIVPKETHPGDMRLDPDGWLAYFMDGLSPVKAVDMDISEQP